jgi:hypothetical protein
MAFFLVLLGVAGLGVGARLVAGRLDRDRIRADVEASGGRVEAIEWAPLGHGWFGERGDRIYEVAWRDAKGKRRKATCKTSALSGVYWHTGKPPVPAAEGTAADELERLRAENARLRKELRRGGP